MENTFLGKEYALQEALNIAVSFTQSDAFKKDVEPLFGNCDTALCALAHFAENSENVIPHLQAELAKVGGIGKMSLDEFLKGDGENISLYACMLGKYCGIKWDSFLPIDEIIKQIAAKRGSAPNNFVMPNNLFSREASFDLINAGEPLALEVSKFSVAANGKKSKRDEPIKTFAFVTFEDDNAKIKYEGKYNVECKVYENALATLYIADSDSYFTAVHVWKAIPGNENSTPSTSKIREIEEFLDMCNSIKVDIDATEELISYGATNGVEFEKMGVKRYGWRERLVELTEKYIEGENQHGTYRYRAFRFLKEPVKLAYSRKVGQLITTTVDTLDIRELGTKGGVTDIRLTKTANNMSLTLKLWERIAVMRNDMYGPKGAKAKKRSYDARRKKKTEMPDKPLKEFVTQSHRIILDKAFAEAGVDKADGTEASQRKRRKINCDTTFKCLDYWKAIGKINGYKKVSGSRGGKVEAVDIILK